MDEPTPGQPAGPARPKLARALTANIRRSGEKSTVFGRLITAGLVVVLAGALAVGIGALALHHNKANSPKTANAADKQLDPKSPTASRPPLAGAPAPVPITPPGKAGPGKAHPGTKKPTKTSKGASPHPTAGGQNPNQPLSAASVQTTTIVSYATGRCIDVPNDGQTGVPIQIWDCDPVVDWKRWVFYSDSTIRSQGHCMTVAGGTVAGGSGDGMPIEVASCNGGWTQQFKLNNAHDLVNVTADKCVDVKDKGTANGTRLQLWSCSGTSNQKWHT